MFSVVCKKNAKLKAANRYKNYNTGCKATRKVQKKGRKQAFSRRGKRGVITPVPGCVHMCPKDYGKIVLNNIKA